MSEHPKLSAMLWCKRFGVAAARLASATAVLILWVAFPLSARAAPEPPVALKDVALRLIQARALVKSAEDSLRLVENGYTQRPETSAFEAQERRFSDGEIQFLLTDYAHAAVLFYDLVSDAVFREHNPRYPDALNYLAESLYQQGNLLGARLYLRQLLAFHSSHEHEALARFLEVAGKLNDYENIDPLIEQAQRNSGGQLPPELNYVYGKWLFKRTDLSDADRWARAEKVFTALSQPNGRFRWQGAYFLAVLSVQRKDLKQAAERFRAIGKEPLGPPSGSGVGPTSEIHELAELSLGRVLFEMGNYNEAIDRYQEIGRESARFPEALYETSWAYVKQAQFEKARNAADLVLLVAPESTLAPEAQLLLAHLQLKLQRYREADLAYNVVINQYGPVRDEIDALLTLHRDPVAYFDRLLARRDKDLDVGHLLPQVALKWATTQQEVAEASRMVGDLETGQDSVKEAREVADRILGALDTRALEVFPTIQEGYTRVNAVGSALTQTEQDIVVTEAQLTETLLTPGRKRQLEEVRDHARFLSQQFARMPHTPQELEARRQRLRERVTAVDKEAFRLTSEIQSSNAVVAALGKWLTDTRPERNNSAEDEKVFAAKVRSESTELSALSSELQRLRAALSQEKSEADVSVGGEEAIQREYADQLGEEREILQSAQNQLSGEAAMLFRQAEEIRAQQAALMPRLARAKGILTEQLQRRGAVIRDKVVAEQKLLAQYGQEADRISIDARQLVGRIAFDSFQRVRAQFYDLVLKADVGLVDVAFTRKQDKTVEIQRLAAEKDHALKSLDEEFQALIREEE